ncbi:MAG TPA: cytochrome c [Kofleriaceae bacterium]|nr:cytochrome c [Kofleriaceae bacterium]
MKHALLLILIASCDWSLHRMQEPVGCTTHGVFAGAPCDRLPPDGVVAIDSIDPAPPQVTRALLARGRDRFDAFCAACHGAAADGDSPVARAMTVRRPPTLVDRAAASLPDERILTVIERGYGLMPSYGSIVAPRDRYAILHYLRALQARDVPLEALSPSEREEARRWLR